MSEKRIYNLARKYLFDQWYDELKNDEAKAEELWNELQELEHIIFVKGYTQWD